MKFSTLSLILAISSSATLIIAVPLGFSNFTDIPERAAVDLSDWKLFGKDESGVYGHEITEWQPTERDLRLRQPTPKEFDLVPWRTIDHGVKIEKFVATAVIMNDVSDPNDSEKKLIHWRGAVAYHVSKKWRSTSLDTRKLSADDPAVQVQLISKNFDVSSRAPYHWEAKVARDYTTSQVCDLLKKKNFNRYLYNGNGSGCLTWTTALVKLFEDEKILAKGSTDSFSELVDKVRKDTLYWVPDGPGAKFY
ncbi:hypothetical protein NP233_g8704 [Leucocoprinus birnbaumii]|uniref:DUF7770 domain-containing protein n=1 Tax=Leucocoprinus birnbaumii TaxID=56174 RepID=A0AAD5VLW4_9AGAR|nr:hypothetical protein NP233_g8704 [Leucocoprinus birnbaumii]